MQTVALKFVPKYDNTYDCALWARVGISMNMITKIW